MTEESRSLLGWILGPFADLTTAVRKKKGGAAGLRVRMGTTATLGVVVVLPAVAFMTFNGHRFPILKEPAHFPARLEGGKWLGTFGAAFRFPLRRPIFHTSTVIFWYRNTGVDWLRSGCDPARPCLGRRHAALSLRVILSDCIDVRMQI
jgi:hypothetical protein